MSRVCELMIPQKGVESEEGLRHEYYCPAGCILIFFGERGMGVVQGVDLTY